MKKFVTYLGLLAMAAGLLSGCGGTEQPTGGAEAPAESEAEELEPAETGSVSIVGSTTVQPVAQSIADEFQLENTGIAVEIQGVGSSAGIKAVIDGTADIGASSRELKEEEIASGVTQHVLAYDCIAVVVNPANPVADLDTEAVKKIFAGEITNWNEVGGNDSDIIVISRESGSGTRDAFEEIIDLTMDMDGQSVTALREDALISEGNGAVKANLASKENAIAYISLGYVDDTVKPVSIGGVTPSVETTKSGEYKLSRPLLLLTSGEVSEAAQRFLDYCLGDAGQKIVSETYISSK